VDIHRLRCTNITETKTETGRLEAAADAVVLVVSEASAGRGWVNEEFAATIASVAAGRSG
jgi:hypothetical protein